MKKILMAATAFFILPVWGDELVIPSRCDLYADDSDFSCCVITYRKRPNIHFEFYARQISLTDDISEVEDFLGVYFDFARWPSYADSSKNVTYNTSVGSHDGFSMEHETLTHETRYTIAAHLGRGVSIPIKIKENSVYKKRPHPAKGAITSYDFSLLKGAPVKGLKSKEGSIHITKDKHEENLLLYLKFQIDPGPIANNIGPKIAVRAIENAFEDLLKGMMNTDHGCDRYSGEETASDTQTASN